MTETLCYGTGLGYIAFVRRSPVDVRMSWFTIEFTPNIDQMLFQETHTRRLGLGFEITCMSWDMYSEGSTQIAVRTRDKIVQVFGVYDGNFIKLKGDDGAVLKEYSCQSVIGHVAVNQKRGVFVVDNATDGKSVPKQVAFDAKGRLVVGGSDNGLVYIFERKSGKLLETLHHSNARLVQTIATRDISGHCIVISGSQALGRGKATVNLWVNDYGMKKETLTSEKYWSLSHVLMQMLAVLIHIGALLVTLCFLTKNYVNHDTISADLAQRMRHTWAFFINDLQKVCTKQYSTKYCMRKKKLMDVIQEVQGDVGEDESAIYEKDDIAAEAKRVFYETLRIRQLDTRGDDSGGKDVILT
ncbi:hypothetical protein BD769DRAFT_1385124 [Suillus cothurnatus]|nr:hypothetical protein BD769DRAFT_1385124 [Suillus cothurnatus]